MRAALHKSSGQVQRHLYRVEDVFSSEDSRDPRSEEEKEMVFLLVDTGGGSARALLVHIQGACVALAQHDGEKVSLLRVFN